MKVVLSGKIYTDYLFRILKEVVFASGGDGFGVVVCKNPLVMGKKFFEWLKLEGYFLEEHAGQALITDRSNENFVFSSRPVEDSTGHRDIVIELAGPVVEFSDEVVEG